MEILSVLIWVSIVLFVASIFLEEKSYVLASAGWIAFGTYWLTRFPYYYNETHSMIKSGMTLVALPLSAYVAYVIYTDERDVLVRVSQAVAAMGLLYLPFAFFQPLSNFLIEHTAAMEYRILTFLDVPVQLTERDGLRRQIEVTNPSSGEVYKTYVILACTGIGSMSIFGGVIAAVRAPLRQKVKALSVAIPVIYVLNLTRTAFISTAYGYQWLQVKAGTVSDLMGEPYSYASFFWADKVISQSLSVVALIGITLVIVRFMPEVMDLINEILDIVIGKEKTDKSTG